MRKAIVKPKRSMKKSRTSDRKKLPVARVTRRTATGSGTQPLLYLAADILRDNELLERFLRDPDAVAADYRLSAQSYAALVSIDPVALAKHVEREVLDIAVRGISPNYPVTEAEIRTQEGATKEEMRERGVQPRTIEAKVATKLRVQGVGVMTGARLICTPEQGGPPVEALCGTAAGSFEERVVHVSVRLSPGVYRLSLVNCEGAPPLDAGVLTSTE